MRCVYCRSRKLELDENTGMYFCKKCNRILSPEEVDPKIKKQDIKLMQEIDAEYEENHVSDAVPIEGEDIGVFTLVLLGFLGGVPVFDFLSAAMVEWSELKDEYKRTIISRLIARVFTIVLIVGIGLIGLKVYDFDYRLKVHETLDTAVGSVHRILNKVDMTPELAGKTLAQIERSLSYEPIDVDEVDEIFRLQVKWSYLDSSIIKGDKFLQIVEDTSKGNMTYLVQTLDIVSKFDDKTYRNVGAVITDSEREGTNDNFYYVGNIDKTFTQMLDDYNEPVSEDLEDLYKSKFIFYIKESSEFRFNILRNENNEIIGFAVTELNKVEI